MSADLHLHTLHSDGSWSTEQLVEAAIGKDLKTIAITDHDTVAGIREAIDFADNRIEIIPGIEINTIYEKDGKRKDIHILGLFIDPSSPALAAIIKRQQDARNRLVDETVQKCQSLGIPLTHDLVRECAGNGSIGRPHLTRAIVKAGGADSINAAYERFMQRSSPDYIARHSIQPHEAIAAINEAGGISSIAHPGRDEGMEDIILDLKSHGLRAIEVYHRSHSLELLRKYLKFAAANQMLVTGGSDCHGPSEGYPASIGTIRVPPDVVSNLKAALAQV
jgi:predicted metal-dependent phosphoesterase TrpH